MKRIVKLVFPILCSLAFIACKNQPSAGAGETPASITEETTVVEEDETMQEGEEWELTFHKASELKASALAKKLEALTFFDKPKQTQEEIDESGRFEEVTKLYPLGWSKEGNFAYAEYSMMYHEEHRLVYTIKNMHSGETIWQQEMTYGIAEEGADEESYSEFEARDILFIKGGESEAELFNYVWAASEKALSAALKKAGIVVNPSGKFLAQTNYKGISFTVEEQETQDKDNPMKYYLKSNQYDPVLIYEDYFPVGETKVVGVIKSPQSETIAVVCRQKRQFFEMTDEIVPILVGYKLE